MSERTKKILLFSLLAAGTIALAFLLYFFFKKVAPTAPPTGAGVPTGPAAGGQFTPAGQRVATTTAGGAGAQAGLPTAGAIPGVKPSYYQPEPVTKIASEKVSYFSIGPTGGTRFYNPNDGKFYQVSPDGTSKTLSDQTFYNVKNVTWAPKNNKAVLEYPDGSKIIYDFEKQKQATLPKHWSEFSFSSDGAEIAAKSVGLSPENRWLVTVNDDGTGTKLIEPMGENADKVIVDWSPSRQAVAFSMTGNALGLYRKEVLLIGLNGENFKSLTVEGMGFKPQWSPTGKQLLYSVYSDRSNYKPELWLTNSYGQDIGSGRKNLELNTWANKCAFSGDETLYCAVPRNLPQGSGISPAVADSSYDDFYKVDLKTGLKTLVNISDNYSVDNVSFDQAGNRLVFTDRNQSGVFEIKL